MSDDVTLRRARGEDSPVIARLAGEQMGHDVAAEDAAERVALILARRDHELLVAEHEGRVVGLAHLVQWPTLHGSGTAARLMTIVVDSAQRGKGVGTRLVAAAEDWALAQAADSVHLTSGTHREGAHAFYRRLGYDGTGVRFRKNITPRPGPSGS